MYADLYRTRVEGLAAISRESIVTATCDWSHAMTSCRQLGDVPQSSSRASAERAFCSRGARDALATGQMPALQNGGVTNADAMDKDYGYLLWQNASLQNQT